MFSQKKKMNLDDHDHDDDSSSKRNLERNDSSDDKRRRSLPSFESVVSEVIRQNHCQRLQHVLEPMLRKVIKEEVESAIRKHVVSYKRNSEEDVLPSEYTTLQLKFLSALNLPVFTGTRIEGEDGSAIKVVLVDSLTDEVVQYAPESSAKVEIVVLEGDFEGDEGENWTFEDFKANIVKEREGKKPLLTGDVYLHLKEGIGSVGEISFTDNSSWTRSRRFRLGARVAGNSDAARIREAKTESFIVRDHRGELYKKHHPPSLSDEVWRLEKIGKDGAFHKRLSFGRVNTVKDFLTLLNLDPTRLKNILGSGMSAKMWEITVEHARTSVLDEKVYLYYSPSSPHRKGVVFNVVGQIMGFYSESLLVPFDKLDETDKLDAQRMVIEAFQHWDGVISFEDMSSFLGVLHSANSSATGTPDARSALTSEKTNYFVPNMASPDIFSSLYSMGCMSSSDDFSLQTVDALDMRFDYSLNAPALLTDSLLCSTVPMTPALCGSQHTGIFDIDCFESANPSLESDVELHSVCSGFLQPRSSAQSIRGTGQRKWRVLSSIFRWFTLRREVVTKRVEYQDFRRYY